MRTHKAQEAPKRIITIKKRRRWKKRRITAPLGMAPEQARDLGDHARNKGKDTPNVFLLIHYNDLI